jgi:hypothetical protein
MCRIFAFFAGFIILGSLLLFSGTFLFFFPRTLPTKAKRKQLRQIEKDNAAAAERGANNKPAAAANPVKVDEGKAAATNNSTSSYSAHNLEANGSSKHSTGTAAARRAAADDRENKKAGARDDDDEEKVIDKEVEEKNADDLFAGSFDASTRELPAIKGGKSLRVKSNSIIISDDFDKRSNYNDIKLIQRII